MTILMRTVIFYALQFAKILKIGVKFFLLSFSEDPANEIVMFDLDIQKRIVYFVAADNSIYSRQIDLAIYDTARDLIVADNRKITGK